MEDLKFRDDGRVAERPFARARRGLRKGAPRCFVRDGHQLSCFLAAQWMSLLRGVGRRSTADSYRLDSLFSPEADQELIADFFAHVIFSGCRDFQCDSDCE